MGRLSLMSVLIYPHGTGQAVAIWLSDDPDRRAPTALCRWLEHPGARHPDAPLFVGLRALSLRCRYSGHSLRAGFATAAARAQLHDVMRQPRHKSVKVARRYMRPADFVAQQRHREGHAPSNLSTRQSVQRPKQS
jgi:integrase